MRHGEGGMKTIGKRMDEKRREIENEGERDM